MAFVVRCILSFVWLLLSVNLSGQFKWREFVVGGIFGELLSNVSQDISSASWLITWASVKGRCFALFVEVEIIDITSHWSLP